MDAKGIVEEMNRNINYDQTIKLDELSQKRSVCSYSIRVYIFFPVLFNFLGFLSYRTRSTQLAVLVQSFQSSTERVDEIGRLPTPCSSARPDRCCALVRPVAIESTAPLMTNQELYALFACVLSSLFTWATIRGVDDYFPSQ